MAVKQRLKLGVVASLFLFFPATAFAAQAASSSFQVNEVFFGNGGDLNECSSTAFCAKVAAGETAVGNPNSPTFQAHAGFNTNRAPYLQFLVNGVSVDVGGLSTGSTTTTTATFSVKSYLSSGYSVVTTSNPPKNNTYTMTALSSPTASSAGTEQFGMNLVKNPSCSGLPANLGNDPAQIPSSTFGFGAAASGYNTACQFKYHAGDTIASSSSSSGETDYTISYIYNISVLTPGGTYTFNDVLVATATF